MSPSLKTETINPIHAGFCFGLLSYWTKAGGGIRPLPLNSKNIEAMRTKFGREIVRPKALRKIACVKVLKLPNTNPYS